MARGDHCDCQLLALAVGAPLSAVDYTYCRNVLQRHWRVTCLHVEKEAPEVPRAIPPVRAEIEDVEGPIKAILIENASGLTAHGGVHASSSPPAREHRPAA